jgi:hypothetical protein
MRALLALVLVLIASPAAAQREPEWRTAPEYDVLLRPFAYEPRTIRLQDGQPVKLRFVNEGRATLSLSAPRFFRSARLRRGDEDLSLTGRFRLAPGERRTIALVPARGRYAMSSFNFVQRVLGMRGVIIVE